jgi:hypothetical protein
MVRGSLSPLALRKDAVKSFGKSISEQFNVGETPEEKAAWEEKKREFNSTRSCTVETSKDRLIEFGFTEAEIAGLFSANFRMDMNTAAHSMEARTMVFLLKNMRIKAVYRNALEKVFEFVCSDGYKQIN